MKLLAAIRTLVASCIVPGWGFWIVGKPRLGLAACGGTLALILLFSWTRLVIDPRGYLTLVVLVLALLAWSAIHSAINELRRDTARPRNWSASLIYAAVAFAVLYPLLSFRSYTLGYEAFRIPARSMAPALVVGDYIVADTWHYEDNDIQIGEIALFETPGTNSITYVKRVVGLPGDVLAHTENKLIRNGVAVAEPFAVYGDSPGGNFGSFLEVTVPEGQYFVMGDNRNFSTDSRHMGTIPKAKFVGRAAHVWYSRNEQEGIQWQRFPKTID